MEESEENFWGENEGRRNEKRLTKLALNKKKTLYGTESDGSSEEDEMDDEVMMLEKEKKRYGLKECRKSCRSKM